MFPVISNSPTLAAAFAAVFLLAACGEDPGVDDNEEAEINLDDDTLAVLGVYEILPGDTLRSTADPEHVAVFERFAEVIPPSLRPEVTHFVAIDQEASGGTDGAMQHPADDEGLPIYAQYYIALDATGSSSGATLDRTMVHEFAHLLTLRPGQVTPLTAEQYLSGEPVECEVYASPACPTEDSYLFDYFSVFYYAEDADYDPDEYPTEYAATIPTEDVAEVFAEWVLDDGEPFTVTDDGVERDVEPGTILEDKLTFFADYPEVVDARELIRAGLDLG